MRLNPGLGAAIGLTAVVAALAAPPPDLAPRGTTETPPRWSLRHRRWPRLDYVKGHPRLPDHPRPPPPEYAFWYWALERQARERGDPDPWIVRQRRLDGYPHPQPGVALGEALDNGRDPERPAPDAVRRLRGKRSEGAALAADPTARGRYREPRPGEVYEVHSPWCEGPPRPLCHGERRPPPPSDTAREGGGYLPPEVAAVVEGKAPEVSLGRECRSPPPWEAPPVGDCDHERTESEQLASPVPKDLEGMRALGEALATRPPDACHFSCVGCHAGACGSLAGIFPRFPAYHGGVNRIIGLEEQVNLCRTKRQDLHPLRPSSPAMAAVLVYLRELE